MFKKVDFQLTFVFLFLNLSEKLCVFMFFCNNPTEILVYLFMLFKIDVIVSVVLIKDCHSVLQK